MQVPKWAVSKAKGLKVPPCQPMRVMCKSVVLEARNLYGLRRNSSVYVYFFCVHESRTTVADAGSDLEYVWLLIWGLRSDKVSLISRPLN